MKKNRPNILYIMADDHASMALSCYGSYRNQTPNLDKIAKEGIRLDNCFCTNSICTPSRASILTGQYAHVNGSITFNALKPTSITFPQILRNHGYFTTMIGKWHLHCEPTGFNTWCVLPGQGRYQDPVFINNGVFETVLGYVTDIITDKTLEILENRPQDQPFCILSHHKAPHDPWESDEKHAKMYEDVIFKEPSNLLDDYKNRAIAIQKSTQRIGSTDIYAGHTVYEKETGMISDPIERFRAQYQEYMKNYLRCIASIDDNIGRILDYLDESGLVDNTLVIYTSDQGFFMGEHGWYDKRFMYEESLRMPFIARYPNVIPPGSSDDHIILNTDFAATLLDFAGLQAHETMQSESFKSILEGQPITNWREIMYYRYYWSHFNTPSHWGVRTKRFKLIQYNPAREWELFDLEKDPNEMYSVYSDPTYAETVTELKKKLIELRKELGDTERGLEGEIRARGLLFDPSHPYFHL